ncbi:hypothetical protein QFC20_007591 [Naganishia adeliensis]|uniref:Uncharacterized protein n=1 Tax=Naganishia adeliensis TaxID=92952 RepID=A0ACC2UX40_9TREE|nr:hypothetical protein QFC20_007591 [Naganishia adeliensis]
MFHRYGLAYGLLQPLRSVLDPVSTAPTSLIDVRGRGHPRPSPPPPVQGFPEPPERTAAPAKSRPKQHLVYKPMDKSKLMPPKKSALKRQSQFAGAPPVQESTGDDEDMGNVPDARELSRRSMVRFDLHRMSADSTLSTMSSSSAESLLAGIIPAKPPATRATQDGTPSRQEQPPLSMHMSETDSIYDGIVQQAHRADLSGSTLVRRKGTKPNSPSRLSYLLSEDSSSNSPFADPETPDMHRSPVRCSASPPAVGTRMTCGYVLLILTLSWALSRSTHIGIPVARDGPAIARDCVVDDDDESFMLERVCGRIDIHYR